ncbi:MAG: bifunctional (p)ppGpp synthetase/guanosine-3',5'-bis(diphosphate) 3'-pyrophosphohydrolase [Candidatus Pacebacteria bacterium]|nr:bifunctional (p)ppGpp synthetase/guanosine-3',5'-bis(diphosphate) 3'-pyrophosphohydrolase [Candidatus Paceibacterota bacterium]
MYSYRVEQAIRAASILHQDQLRIGSLPLPYISHLMAVVLILSDYTDDEDTIVAAFLHDTLEDTDYTVEELREDFGGPVSEIVLTLTEPKLTSSGAKIPWLEQKKIYAKQLKAGSEKALTIAAADKAHNFRTIIEEYHDDHKRFIQDFGPQTADRMEAYQTIANIINSRLKSDIVHEFNHTFTEFKKFLIDVEKTTNAF